MHANELSGEVITKSFLLMGHILEVNVETEAGGWLKISLLDYAQKELAVAKTIHNASSVNYIAEWEGDTQITDSVGQHVLLKFEMVRTKLHAFQVKA